MDTGRGKRKRAQVRKDYSALSTGSLPALFLFFPTYGFLLFFDLGQILSEIPPPKMALIV